MEIGQLDRRITLKSYTSSQNDYGEMIDTYDTGTTVWAAVRFGSGNERMVADKATVVGDVIFTIRFRAGLTEKTRIVWDGINWDIQHIAYLGRRQFIDIIAKKVV
jgi:SPP1 family predicted phage head-tail adaptor